jgi:hypothetical protein
MTTIFSSNNSSSDVNALSIMNSFTSSLLSVGRRAFQGVGLSARSRELTEAYLTNVQGSFNSLMSLATGPSLTVEGLQTQIKGLRATLPISMLHESVTVVADENVGQNVDTEA